MVEDQQVNRKIPDQLFGQYKSNEVDEKSPKLGSRPLTISMSLL